MMRSYDKFSQAERRLIRQWQIAVTAGYGAVFLLLLTFVIVNHTVSGWTSQSVHADMPKAAPAADAAQITLSAKTRNMTGLE